MTLRLISIAAILAFAISCSKSSDSNTDPIANVQEATKETTLQENAFLSECQSKPINEIATGLLTLGEASVKSQRVQFQFSGANMMRTTRLYATPDCLGVEAFVFEESGSFAIHENQKTGDGATFIDFNFVKVEVIITSQVGVVIANRIGVCNLTDWNVNDRKDVTTASGEVTCYSLEVPRREYNVYRIDNGNTLFFGTQASSNSPEQRPASIKSELKYSDQ